MLAMRQSLQTTPTLSLPTSASPGVRIPWLQAGFFEWISSPLRASVVTAAAPTTTTTGSMAATFGGASQPF